MARATAPITVADADKFREEVSLSQQACNRGGSAQAVGAAAGPLRSAELRCSAFPGPHTDAPRRGAGLSHRRRAVRRAGGRGAAGDGRELQAERPALRPVDDGDAELPAARDLRVQRPAPRPAVQARGQAVPHDAAQRRHGPARGPRRPDVPVRAACAGGTLLSARSTSYKSAAGWAGSRPRPARAPRTTR